MSDDFLRWVPLDPAFVPSDAAARRAVAWLEGRAPKADDVEAHVHPEIVLVDCGANLESIRCGACDAELTLEWWVAAVDRAAETAFQDRRAPVPCCGGPQDLAGLRYDWPIAFGRFVLEARNPRMGEPTADDDRAVAEILGAPVRVIAAHY